MFNLLARVSAALAPLVIVACAHTEVGPGFIDAAAELDPRHFQCCADPEHFYPEGLIRTAFAIAEDHGPKVADKMYGRYKEEGYPGRLAGNSQAEAALLEQLHPLDIILTANKSYVWGSLIPGRFTHDLIYLGTEAQLRAAGLWETPGFASLQDDVRAGRLFAEAATPMADTVAAGRVLESDGIAVLRPRLSPSERRAALAFAAASIGRPYDYTFDTTSADRLACTELVYFAMPGLGIDPIEAYGKMVIFPDQLAAQAIRGERMEVVGYLVGNAGGYEWRNLKSMMADIAAYWGIPGSNS